MSSSSQDRGTKPAIGSKRKRANPLDVLPDLERRLPLIKADTVAAAALADDVRRRIVEASSDVGLKSRINDVDDEMLAHKAAVQLWNLVLRLDRESDSTTSAAAPAEYRRLLLCSRVFAFVVIHRSTCPDMSTAAAAVAGEESSTRSHVMYLLGVAIRTVRSCIDGNAAELGRLVLEKASTYKQYLNRLFSSAIDDEDTARQKSKFKQLENNHVIYQMTQLWRENRPHDADKLYTDSKASHFKDASDAMTSEELARALFDIGKGLLSKKDFPAALTWLDRARNVLPEQGQAATSLEVIAELRISIVHSLAIASLGVQTPEGHKRAAELAQSLESNTGDNDRRVQLIRLELFASPLSETFDGRGYANVLLQMVTAFNSSVAEFQLLHHHIQKLHNKSPGLGCNVLDEFMLALRHRDNATECIERLIITRVWLLAHQRETQEELDAAENVLSKLRIPISADTAAAAQTLIWKRIEQGYQERHYPTATRWCRLALCHIFEASGRTNRPLIERKLLLCSIESGDLEAAKSIYISMPEPTRDEPMTKYLLYKLSIKANDLEMATECLRSISMSAEKKELLHACVLHARHAKAPRFMVQAMKKLADTINHNDPNHVHTPALFRCTILMLRDMIDGGAEDAGKITNSTVGKPELAIHDLADVFRGVVDAIEADRDNHAATEHRLFTIDELEWFCRAAYNLGLKYSGKWDLRCTVFILETCVRITGLFPIGQDTHVATDLPSKRLTCRFLIASALAALARRPPLPDAEEQMLKDCHAMREHIRAFQTELKQSGKLGDRQSPADLLSKLSVLLIFDFEGAIRLGDWDELESICEIAATGQNTDTLRVLGDSLLQSQAQVPSQKFVSTMRLIVSKLHETDKFDSVRLVKYYRCLFQAALYRDNDAAFHVLGEVGRMMQVGLGSEAEKDWPEEELQFLAAVAFNEGIDWFAGGREDQARQWVLSAASLADQCHDGGKLKGLICARFGLLNIGELEIKQSVESDVHDTAAAETLLAVDSDIQQNE